MYLYFVNFTLLISIKKSFVVEVGSYIAGAVNKITVETCEKTEVRLNYTQFNVLAYF